MLSNLAQPTTPSGQAAPVTAHRLFPVMVATWFAVLFGIGSLVVPTALVELLVVKSGFAGMVAAAAPPLGATARGLVALGCALVGGGLGYMLARKVAANSGVNLPTHRPNSDSAPELAAHDEPPVRRPIMAREELGSDTLDAPAENTGLLALRRPSIPGRRRGLTTETEDAPLELLAHGAQADVDVDEEAAQSHDLAEPETHKAEVAEPQEALDLESFVTELHILATPRDEDGYAGTETIPASDDDELSTAADVAPGFSSIAEVEDDLNEDEDAPLVFAAPSFARMRTPEAENDAADTPDAEIPTGEDTEPGSVLPGSIEDSSFDTSEANDTTEQMIDDSTVYDDGQLEESPEPAAVSPTVDKAHADTPLAATATGSVAAIATAPLDTLGTVALAERLGLSLRRRMEQKARAAEAGDAELPQAETVEEPATPGLHGFTALRAGITAAPGVPVIPAALRPLDLLLDDEEESEDDDDFDSFRLTLPHPAGSAAPFEPDDTAAFTPDDEERGEALSKERANSVETEHALRNALATLQRISGAA